MAVVKKEAKEKVAVPQEASIDAATQMMIRRAQDLGTLGPEGQIYVGTDYYPEHWPRDRWAYDAQLMQEAGFSVARLAEFGWVLMEPQEGHYEFEWLDEAIDHALAAHGKDHKARA